MEIIGIPAAALLQGGAGLLVALTVWLVLTGRIVPRSTVDDLRADRDGWKEAHDKILAVADMQSRQVDALMEMSRTTEGLVLALQDQPVNIRKNPHRRGQ